MNPETYNFYPEQNRPDLDLQSKQEVNSENISEYSLEVKKSHDQLEVLAQNLRERQLEFPMPSSRNSETALPRKRN